VLFKRCINAAVREGVENFSIKQTELKILIADFGTAKHISEPDTSFTSFTPVYAPPELRVATKVESSARRTAK
jgi:hypothetical protein